MSVTGSRGRLWKAPRPEARAQKSPAERCDASSGAIDEHVKDGRLPPRHKRLTERVQGAEAEAHRPSSQCRPDWWKPYACLTASKRSIDEQAQERVLEDVPRLSYRVHGWDGVTRDRIVAPWKRGL